MFKKKIFICESVVSLNSTQLFVLLLYTTISDLLLKTWENTSKNTA